MKENHSVKFYIRFVLERHKKIKLCLDELLKVLVEENLQKKYEKAAEFDSALTELKTSLSIEDYPPWLNELSVGITHFKNKIWKQKDLLNCLIVCKPKVDSYEWTFEADNELAFDFDSIFEYYKSKSRLPELFDEIIKILNEIKDSEDVDSLSMISALSKVIATLKKSKDGSYFSINSAWEFLLTFINNYMWAELSKIPGIGSAVQALEKTIKETNDEMFQVHSDVKSEMKSKLESDFKGIKNTSSSFNFITYNRKGLEQTNSTETGINKQA